jgi:hypothetical protein
VLVTFGNAGARGGSGASLPNVDITGDGLVGADESNVRTVVTRISQSVPAAEVCDAAVTLTDTAADLAATSTVTFGNYSTDIGGGTGVEVLTGSAVRTVVVEDVAAGVDGGTLTNTAHLDAEGSTMALQGPSQSYTFSCCPAVDLEASATVPVVETTSEDPPEYCTFTPTQWSGQSFGGNPLLVANFDTLYPSGVEVGVPGPTGFSMRFTSEAAVATYLGQNVTGAGKLTADVTNPVTTASRKLGQEVLALRMNVDFNDASLLGSGGAVLGDLRIVKRFAAVNGLTVRQVLALAEDVLGGKTVVGVGTQDLYLLVSDINKGFQDCTPSSWAQLHLAAPQ